MNPKRRYGDWLKSKDPKIPRSSRHDLQRFEDRHASDHEDDDNNVRNIAGVATGGNGNGSGSIPCSSSSSSSSQQSNQRFSGGSFDDSISDQNSESPSDSEEMRPVECSSSDEDATSPTSQQQENEQQVGDAAEECPAPVQYKKREEFDAPVFPGLSISKFDCCLMCLHYMMRHGLTTLALLDQLKLINAIFEEEVINPSVFIFESLFRGSFEMQFHFYCPSCKAYLGKSSDFDKENRIVECSNELCETLCNIDDNMNGGHFFIYIPMENQLKSILESSPNVWELLNYRNTRQVDDDSICDIFDGSMYKELSAEGQILSDVKNISITCNSDGSPVFKSTYNSLWPIQFRLNELPPNERFSKCNTMVAGLWFGKTDPEMTTFCAPFIKESSKLHREGFSWSDEKGNITISRVAVINCVLDSVARPKMQGTKQFNGYYGCNYCYHPGAVIPDHRHPRYLINVEPGIRMTENFEFLYEVTRKNPKIKDRDVMETLEVTDRSHESIREEMRRVAEGGEGERGVQSLSPFYPLSWFDLTFGFSVDYMHSVLIGTCKAVTNDLFLDSANKDKEFYFGLEIEQVNKRLLEITPPSSVSWFIKRKSSVEG